MLITIGVDIGGNKINFVALENGKIIKQFKIMTLKTKNKNIQAIIKSINMIIHKLGINKNQVQGVGLAVPGPFNKQRDMILDSPNLAKYGLSHLKLAELLEQEIAIPTKMENDANCFILAETLMGAGKGAHSAIGVTLGTGVGGGIIVNNKLLTGAFGGAGEVGHIIIHGGGYGCGCGNKGCLEAYNSQRFLKKFGFSDPRKLISSNSKLAKKVFDQFAQNLGIGLASLVNVIDPEIVVIGGGLSNLEKIILNKTDNEMRKRILSSVSRKNVKLKVAQLGDNAGAIGAALLIE